MLTKLRSIVHVGQSESGNRINVTRLTTTLAAIYGISMAMLNVIQVEPAAAHLDRGICDGSMSHEIQYERQVYGVQSLMTTFEELGHSMPDHFHYTTDGGQSGLIVSGFVSSEITDDYVCVTPPPRPNLERDSYKLIPTPTAESPVENTQSCENTDFASFTLELNEGYNFISLPFTVIGVDNCVNALEYISDLFNAIQPDVNYIYSVGLDEFKYTSNGGNNPELDPSFGFVIVMTTERTVKLHAERPAKTPVEVDFTIRKGYGVYGVPIDSEDLETIGDFFDLFPSVWAIYMQLESHAQVLVQRNDTEYLDESIRGEASYMIHSADEATVTLDGELWENEPESTAQPAPGKPHIEFLVTSWGELKQR